MAEYVATTGLTNDATGARFEQGAEICETDFPADVIANWIEIGVLFPLLGELEVENVTKPEDKVENFAAKRDEEGRLIRKPYQPRKRKAKSDSTTAEG